MSATEPRAFLLGTRLNTGFLAESWGNSPAIGCMMIGVICVLIQFAPTEWRLFLVYYRWKVDHGELWRLLTGQLVQAGWRHLALNLAGLALVGMVGETGSRSLLLWAVGLGVWTGLGIHLGTTLSNYVGLSALLYGLFLVAIWPAVSRRQILSTVCAGYVVLRISVEAVLGHSIISGVFLGGTVAQEAHTFGAFGGIIGVAILQFINCRNQRNRPLIDHSSAQCGQSQTTE